jgi:hypothetical protein
MVTTPIFPADLLNHTGAFASLRAGGQGLVFCRGLAAGLVVGVHGSGADDDKRCDQEQFFHRWPHLVE